jgi:hypothetical protein
LLLLKKITRDQWITEDAYREAVFISYAFVIIHEEIKRNLATTASHAEPLLREINQNYVSVIITEESHMKTQNIERLIGRLSH